MDFAETRIPLPGLDIRFGTVKSVITGLATVDLAGASVKAIIPTGLTVTAADVVALYPRSKQRPRAGKGHWAGLFVGHVLFNAADETGDNDPVPNPRPDLVSGTLVISPVETRSFRNGKWRKDTIDTIQGKDSDNNTGVAFYGKKPRTLAGATISAAWIRVHRDPGGDKGARTTTLWKVTESTRPNGAPTLGANTTGPRLAVGKTDKRFDIPNSWAQDLIAGTIGGLAIKDNSGNPYVRLAGKGSSAGAWSLHLKWSR
jgi:hypothetical protein